MAKYNRNIKRADKILYFNTKFVIAKFARNAALVKKTQLIQFQYRFVIAK